MLVTAQSTNAPVSSASQMRNDHAGAGAKDSGKIQTACNIQLKSNPQKLNIGKQKP